MSTNGPEQNLSNHARFVPGYHYVGVPLVMANFVWCAWRMLKVQSADNGMHLLVAVILFVVLWFARVFPLKAQDRVIRLEERLRMVQLLPADMHGRINDFSSGQLIALRFASDAELPELAKRVLAESMTPKAIKSSVRNWRADHHRV